MKIRQAAIPIFVALMAAGAPGIAHAKAKALSRQKVVEDGQVFKVIRYDNGTVKVVDGGLFGDTVSFNLRDRMRRAARQATGCKITDDFWLDGKLVGTLECAPAKEGASS